MVDDQKCIGSLILAFKSKILNPHMVVNKIPEYDYTNISPAEWYPMKQFTKLIDYTEEFMGKIVVSKIGKGIIPEMKEAGILQYKSPEDMLDGLPQVYTAANKGSNIGQWNLVEKNEKHYIYKNTTLHNCYMEEGVLYGGIEAYGGKFPKIIQKTCIKNGDSSCLFDIQWS